jgi:elongation factor P
MKIDGSAVRAGMVIEHNNKLWLVTRHNIVAPGNWRAMNQVELKDIKTGTKSNQRFSSDEKIERVRLDQKDYQYLYPEENLLVFMDNETYEQIMLDKDLAGDQLPFLQDGMKVIIESYEGEALSLRLPERVTMTIVEADPVVKGQTASSSYKPAKLENGVRVLVPPFIEAGEKIIVNTEDITYAGRAE